MHMTPMTHPTRRDAIVGLVLLGMGWLPVLVAAESGRAVGAVPDEERRSVIQEADGYAHIGKDAIVQLLHNTYRTSHQFKGGKTYRIPDAGDQSKLQVQPPFGPDKIVVYASESPIGNVPLQDIGRDLQRYQGTQQDLARDSRRGVGVYGASDADAPGASFYEATWKFTTHP
jgi:Domain of unknown function (DUF4384)